MDETMLQLSILWIATMLVYLLGDVLRIFSGDFEPGKIEGKVMPKNMYLGMAILMVVPILMVVLSIFLPYEINRAVNIVAAIFWFLFNMVGLPTYSSLYDKFLLVVSMVLNVAVIWVAWNW